MLAVLEPEDLGLGAPEGLAGHCEGLADALGVVELRHPRGVGEDRRGGVQVVVESGIYKEGKLWVENRVADIFIFQRFFTFSKRNRGHIISGSRSMIN